MTSTHLRRSTLLATTLMALIAIGAPARAADSKAVSEALEKAKAYLYKVQKAGTWEEVVVQPDDKTMIAEKQSVKGGQWTGQTALAVYALLAAGEKHTDPRLAPAIDFLKKNPSAGVYALGLRMQVWLELPKTPDVMAAAKRDAEMLLKSVKTLKAQGSAMGMYDYVFDPTGKSKSYSHSRSQYGVLGVWAAEQIGIEIGERYWQFVENAWLDHQAPDGGWTYMKPGETEHATTPGMTAVGVATLFITQDYTKVAEGLACKGNIQNPAIDRGIKWMGDNMDKVATDKRYARDFPFITLYAVERIGVAAGLKYLGGVDWYQKGATWLVKKQGKDGSFAGGGGFGTGAIVDTSYAMLFLARGRAPIAFNKLDYAKGQAGPQAPAWNQRPRDIANLSGWIGRQIEQNLNWQVVPATAPLDDLIDAPILYISGSKPPEFDDAQKQRLREYVHAGGMIVGNSDCANIAFTNGFKKLANELFPVYEFRELPPEHPMFNGAFRRSNWRTKPQVFGLSNNARELMVLIPTADAARQWQSKVVGGKEEMWQLGAAMFMYMSEGKNLNYRGENHLIALDPKVKASRTLTLHRLQHTQNWNPEPGGWARIVNVAHNEQRVAVKLAEAKLGAGQLPAGGLAHLTGTGRTAFAEAQRNEIRKFVESGGLLLIDAAGGDSAFAESMEKELAQIFGGESVKAIPENHPLFMLGEKPVEIRYRPAAQKAMAGGLRAPRLKGVEVNGKFGVIYSREDLSVGIVGHSVDGIIGYDPKTATDLVTAIIAYKAGPEPKPTTKPTTKSTAKPATSPTAKPSTKSAKPAAPKPPAPVK